jgi:integrase
MSIPRRDIDPKNGYARKTINFIMKIIKKALKDAVRLGILVKSPADGIELLAEDGREWGTLSPAEVERLFQLKGNDEGGKIAAIFAAVSGIRLSEITALQIDKIGILRTVLVQNGSKCKVCPQSNRLCRQTLFTLSTS